MKVNVKEIREKLGFSQEMMAEKMNISQSAYARFELQKTKIDLARLTVFANSVGMNFIDVLTFPERYINVRDIGKEIGSNSPEIFIHIKIKEKKRTDIMKLLFGDNNIDILNE
ncbi:MAG: helix-turn-helix transcriptional regulator [Prevotellaceae bacterium]|jgi:transcriptional regulator with XRE-family HTH domain|nr:helix-turn-helix transcriptional regulator [Prevotellaceae bacterium]